MKKLYFIYSLIFFVAFIFIIRLMYLQILTDKYKLNAYNTSIKQEILYPKRGDILDRNGKLLVSNSYSYNLNFIPNILFNEDNKYSKEFDKNGFLKLIRISETKFDSIINSIINKKDYNKNGTYTLIKGINKENYSRIKELLIVFNNFFKIVKKPTRNYLVQGAGNIFGYINEANNNYIKTDSNYYQLGDIVGISGVERSYEKYLRGYKGVRNYIVDRNMKIIGRYKNGIHDIKPKAGSNIILTIDYNLQNLCENLLSGKRGAVVALNPKNGEILSLASSPVINPNDYLDSEKRNIIIRDTFNKPTYDRALQAVYPPGSIFKLLTALVGLNMGVINIDSKYTCKHGFKKFGHKISCHCGVYYKPQGLQSAIARSCNNYFSELFIDILKKNKVKNLNYWSNIMESFGLGKFMGTDLPVGSKGTIPNANFYNKRYLNKWNSYKIISNAIGQGDVGLTTLQMANLAAVIANKGYYYTPHIVKKVNNFEISKLHKYAKRRYASIDSKYYEIIIKGMKDVFNYGTASFLNVNYFNQIGKTGTSQNPAGKDHSVFILIAPEDDPKIAISVVVENGGWGSTYAGPIASLVAEKYITDTIKRIQLMNKIVNSSLYNEYIRQSFDIKKKIK